MSFQSNNTSIISNNTVQIKMTLELQESVKLLNQSQKRMMNHVQSIEDNVIALPDNEDGTMEQKKTKRIATKIKRKRQNKEEEQKEESDSSEDKSSYRHKKQGQKIKGNAHRF